MPLSGPELVAPGGARHAAGDRIVTLAPGAEGALVTSERGTVASVDPAAGTLLARMDDGRLQPFAPADTAADRLAHAYAATAHRSQGATMEAAHAFEDGRGRELAYVKMSRARGISTVYAVAVTRPNLKRPATPPGRLPAVRTFRCRAAGLALLAAAVAACGGVGGPGGAGGGATAAHEASYPVGFRTETFTVTESGADPAGAVRSLVTTVYYPAASGDVQVAAEGAPPATAPGPFPLVLFSHGGGTTGTSYSNLLTRIASAGYVVAAPNYLGQTGDPTSRPADARFVISQVLTTSGDATHPLAGLVDSRRVGAMGHSMGGGITLGFVFNTCCLDERVRAAVLLASARPAYPGEAFPPPGVPALMVHGDADTRAPYAEGRRLFEQMRSPKYLLTIHGGEHTPPFSGETQRADARVVVESIVAFLDRHLKGDPTGLDRLTAAAADPLVATLERG